MVNAVDRLPPTPKISPVEPGRVPAAGKTEQVTPEFREVLECEISTASPLRFSAHAQSRLLSRQIQLTGDQVSRLAYGVGQAAEKGAQDSLVVVDNLAFVVSVANRTVVTAVDGSARNGNVFTQIDSAVIV